MNAPTLAPMEEDARALDEEAVREMNRQFNETPACIFLVPPQMVECGAPATFGTACTRCGEHTGLLCSLHAVGVSMFLGVVTHMGCGASGRACDLIRLIPL